jgi:hypothetical protein
LYVIYINGISFLKYETLATLKTDRPILLFGDQEWADLFPQYYQGKYLENYQAFFQEGRHLNLLLNANFSYLENNPVFARALRLGVPFLCFPALARTSYFDGMSGLEYQNPSELSKKIESVNVEIRRPEFKVAKTKIENLLFEGYDSAARHILREKPMAPKGPTYHEQSQKETQAAVQRYEEWIQRDPDFFETIFHILIRTASLPMKLEESRFRDRDYFQRLLHMRSKLKTS